ncbi:hypothetical protein EJ02DRAFT_374124 [Clathrospora elynae]|uniref:Zn(2)-C6 fungal-type domain-containing protein n=1 Tax=Clathrospora elynae TaxID=706981 RepID=A0A6A5T2D4_9PLEO|nr:hypothetical protein EJ02DRAFT_374124 [Clathrospora elynae]
MTGENIPRVAAVRAYENQPPPAPSMQQQPSPVPQLSPSTVKASPQPTTGPLVANGNAEATGKPQAGTRASIACNNCRKSKTKCRGGDQTTSTACQACVSKNHECSWEHPTPVSSNGTLRRDSTADFEGPTKKRRKLHTSSAAQGLGTHEDALESPLLTAQVWEELFGIYEKHFSIDFPFLQKKTFLSSVQQQQQQRQQQQQSSVTSHNAQAPTPSSILQPYPPLLLAFLTQTARFHEKLVQEKNNDPIATAQFYAQATRTQMGTDILDRKPTLEMTQTLLLLGYYEWTALQGTKGWMKITHAISIAIVLGYPYIDDKKKVGAKENESRRGNAFKEGEIRLSEKDQVILRETRRRTFWSCCLMDCYLSWGRNRPPMLRKEHFQNIQLPCTDGAFEYGRKVQTRLLGEDDAAYSKRRAEWRESANREHDNQDEQRNRLANQPDDVQWEVGDLEGELTWYIKVVDVFGEIVKWSCDSGRRQEGKIPPWDQRTTFKKLEDKLKRLKANLPGHLQLTSENTGDRVFNGSGKYVLIHAMYTMCFVWLYREYMATSPWTVTHPKGPIDEPLIEDEPPDPRYWVNQAKDCWRACSDFTNMLHTIESSWNGAESSSSHSNLVETPTVAFACFTVSICTIYCAMFPNMDPDNTLSPRLKSNAHGIAHRFLKRASGRFVMVQRWITLLVRWKEHCRNEKAKYKELGGQVSDSPNSSSSELGGGGLKDYEEKFEQDHKQFGDMDTNDNSHWAEKDVDLANSRLPHDDDSSERTLPSISAPVKHEKPNVSNGLSARTPSVVTPFTSINSQANHANGAIAPLGARLSHYEPQKNIHPFRTDSTSLYQPHASPTNGPHLYGTSHPQSNVSAPQVNLRSDQSHGHMTGTTPMQTEIVYPWSQSLAPDPHASGRRYMEQMGAQGQQNTYIFDPLMRGDHDGFNNTSTWGTDFDVSAYDTNDHDPSFYPNFGQNYPYDQQH